MILKPIAITQDSSEIGLETGQSNRALKLKSS